MKALSAFFLVKAILYRVAASGFTLALVWIVTGSWKAAGGVAALDAIGKILLMWGWEHLWYEMTRSLTKRQSGEKIATTIRVPSRN